MKKKIFYREIRGFVRRKEDAAFDATKKHFPTSSGERLVLKTEKKWVKRGEKETGNAT